MALVVGAVEPGARHRDGLPAIKAGVPGDGSGVQRGRAGDELEHAARFVQVAHGLVAPLGLLGQLQGGRPLLPREGIYGGAGSFVVEDARLVGVVGRGGGHGQHGPGVHVQHDAHGTGGHMVFLYGIIQRIFEIMLNVGVDGQPQAAALHRELLGLVALLQRVAPGVHGGEHHAVLPGELLVVFQLQPAHSGVVHIGKAQHRRQKLPLRVPALAVLIDTDAGDAVFLAEIPHGIRHGTLHPVAQQTVVGGAVPELFQQGGFVQLQNLRKTVGGQLQFVGRHLPRAGPQGPAAAVGRQQHAVGTVDAAPVGGHHGVPQLLPQCPPGVPVPGGQLQPVEPGNKPCKADAAQKQRHQPGTGAERLLRQGAQGFGPGHGSTSFSGSVYAGRACGYD